MLTASGFAPVTEQVVVDGGPADVTLHVTPPRPARPNAGTTTDHGRHEAPEADLTARR
jgi:hypothetical protein